MKTRIVSSLLSIVLIASLAGCGLQLPNKAKEEEQKKLEEQQALIGTYAEDGSLIVGFDENGWAITESQEPTPQMEAGISAEELLATQLNYNNIVITAYNKQDKPIYVENFEVDSVSKISKKSWYNGSSMGTLYYDNATNKGYINNNMAGWEQTTNEQIKNVVVYFNPDKMRDINMEVTDFYIKVTGEINSNAIDKSPLMLMVKELYPSTTSMNLEAYYDKDTHFIKHLDLFCNTSTGSNKISLTTIDEDVNITIPEYVTRQEVVEVNLADDIQHIPLDAYIWDVLYNVTDVTEIDRNYLINAYKFKANELKKTYDGIDVNSFLEQLEQLDLNKSVEEFIQEYQVQKDLGYQSVETKAIYEFMYDRLMGIDKELTEMNTAYNRKPPEKKRAEELTEEQQALIGTEAEDGSGIIEWFYDDGTPIVEEKLEPEEPEEPEYTMMYATTNVNKRSGPGTNYDKLGQCKTGEVVKVIGPAEGVPDWSECIDDEGNKYYIKTSYLK